MPKPLLPVSEESMYLQWERSAHPGSSYRLRDGRDLVVLSRGVRNRSAGPDYPGALLLLDGELRSGAVEMHRQEAEWYAHGHDSDSAYGDVVLHLIAADSPGHPVDLPTLHYGELDDALNDPSPRPIEPEDEPLGGELLAEFAWRRLLRRADQVIAKCRRPLDERANASVLDLSAIDPDALRRTFLSSAFDALGYHQNRGPMQRLAKQLIKREWAIKVAVDSAEDSFERVAAIVLAEAGIDPKRLISGFGRSLEPVLLQRLLRGVEGRPIATDWDYETRPGNLPERRIWGAVELIVRLYRDDLLVELARRVVAFGVEEAARTLVVRRRAWTFIGEGRGREIIVNGVLPVLLAGALAAGEKQLIASICVAYRTASSLPTNHLIGAVERRYLGGRRLLGAFWQQGAIEFSQCLYPETQASPKRIAEYSETETTTVWQTKYSKNTLRRRGRSPISIPRRPSLVGIKRPTCPTVRPRRVQSRSLH